MRHIDPVDARIIDVLDAARRLVLLDRRHLDRVSEAGHLATTATMHRIAHEVAERAGYTRRDAAATVPATPTGGRRLPAGERARADRLIADTHALAMRCAQHPRRDLGIGSVHLPEPEVLGIGPGVDPQEVLVRRCRAAVHTRYPDATERERHTVEERLGDELEVVAALGYPTYFLTVASVVDLIREMGVRVAARGSGAGSLINYLLGISGVDPIRYDLLMERFCSPLRAELPDIDIDVESARRTEIYERILQRYGGERVTCVSMMDTYKVRHAIRDVGAALGMPPVEVDEIAKAFPHIRAKDARDAIADLPELRARGLDGPQLATLFDLVEKLDGLPRHIAVHPCGVVLSNGGLLDRTPVEASWLGFPMSQFDKDDVESLGLLKLDILGIRMQSAMAHAVAEVARVDGTTIDLDDRSQVPLDDERTFAMIRTTHTLGCFQIESPGQRELIGKFGPVRFEDLIIDISLFRPGPVKSDMIRPFLEARHGWSDAQFLHPTLIPALQETEGVVVFHEQMLRIIAETTGVSLAQSDEVRRAMGSPKGQEEIEAWWRPAAAARGYPPDDVDRIWAVLKAFASFGFCKAHAAAFALPTYQSAWLKAHHLAAFLAGVLTHDPGMYPKRLILDDARTHGVTILGLDVNASGDTYRVERLPDDSGADLRDRHPRPPPARSPRHPDDRGDLPDGRGCGIRVSLADVSGISAAEVARIVAGQPYASLSDFWHRAQVSRPVLEKLVLAGGFDGLYGLGSSVGGLGRHGRITRRDLLLGVAELDRWDRGLRTGPGRRAVTGVRRPSDRRGVGPADIRGIPRRGPVPGRRAGPPEPVQLALDLGDEPQLTAGSGLPDMSCAGTHTRRAGHPRARCDRPRHGLLCPDAARARRHPELRPARRAQQQHRPGRRGQGRHPDPAGPLRAPGRLPHPRGRHRTVGLDLLRGRPGSVCRDGLPLLAPPRARHHPPDRCPGDLAAGDRGLGARRTLGGLAGRRHRPGPRCRSPRAISPSTATATRSRGAHRRRRGPAPGPGPRHWVPPVTVCRHPPAGGEHPAVPQALALQSGVVRMVTRARTHRGPPDPAGPGPPAPPTERRPARARPARAVGTTAYSLGMPTDRRLPVRVDTALATATVWATVSAHRRPTPAELARPLRVLDLGGGTGGLAVPLAEAGHRVIVVDPSPDALASLRRRAAEAGVDGDILRSTQGDADDLRAILRAPQVDLVCLHGTLEVVDDPAHTLRRIAEVVTPGGYLSVVDRPAAGRGAWPVPSPATSTRPGRSWRAPTAGGGPPTRCRAGSTRRPSTGSSSRPASTVERSHGVRLFSDLVPTVYLDSESDREALSSPWRRRSRPTRSSPSSTRSARPSMWWPAVTDAVAPATIRPGR